MARVHRRVKGADIGARSIKEMAEPGRIELPQRLLHGFRRHMVDLPSMASISSSVIQKRYPISVIVGSVQIRVFAWNGMCLFPRCQHLLALEGRLRCEQFFSLKKRNHLKEGSDGLRPP